MQNPLVGSSPTVADALTAYLSSIVVEEPGESASPGAIRPQTFEQYTRDAVNICELMGDMLLKDLTTMKAETRLRSLIDVKAGTGFTKARTAKGTLNRALRHAVRLDVLRHNPMTAVQIPRPPRATPVAPSQNDLGVLRAALHGWVYDPERSGPKGDPRSIVIIELMLATGMRIGEVLALRWKDIDFAESLISVNGTLIERGPARRQDTPKTSRSRRVLHLLPYIHKMLMDLKQSRGASLAPFPTSPVFATRTGRWVTSSDLRRQLRSATAWAQKHAGTARFETKIHPHAMRKAVATAIAWIDGVEAAAEQLGHSDTRVTSAHYLMPRAVTTNRSNALASLAPKLPKTSAH